MAFPAFVSLLPSVIGGISGFFERRQKRKAALETAEAKLKQKKQDASLQLDLNDDEWEAIGQGLQGSTWKDEYVTLIVTLPIPLLIFAAIAQAFTGDPRLLDGIRAGVSELQALGVDWGTILPMVILAAIGMKWTKAK